MDASTPHKIQLRTLLRERRRRLGLAEKKAASATIAHHAQSLRGWDSARRIALYRDTAEEIGTEDLTKLCLSEGKSLYLPVVEDNLLLDFARWSTGDPLRDNRLGIGEPLPGAERCPVEELDILFMPLVGWDKAGNRLGMGGGYYDRTLEARSGPLLVGLAFSAQEHESLPSDDWDIALDAVLTESGIHPCSPGDARRWEQTTLR